MIEWKKLAAIISNKMNTKWVMSPTTMIDHIKETNPELYQTLITVNKIKYPAELFAIVSQIMHKYRLLVSEKCDQDGTGHEDKVSYTKWAVEEFANHFVKHF